MIGQFLLTFLYLSFCKDLSNVEQQTECADADVVLNEIARNCEAASELAAISGIGYKRELVKRAYLRVCYTG